MCLILDTNKYDDYLDLTNKDMKPVRDWVEKNNGRIAYTPTEKMEKELKKGRQTKIEKQFDKYKRSGKLKIIPKDKVQQAEQQLKNLKSNDAHIIALAKVANVKLLVSSDKKLHKDFTNPKIIGGKVYQNRSHQHLLDQLTCP